MATNLINNLGFPYIAKETTLLNAATATGAGSVFTPGFEPSEYSWQIAVTGAPTGVSVQFQISRADAADNGGNPVWETVDTSTTTTSEIRHISNAPGLQIRANLATLTGGTAPTVTVTSIMKSPHLI